MTTLTQKRINLSGNNKPMSAKKRYIKGLEIPDDCITLDEFFAELKKELRKSYEKKGYYSKGKSVKGHSKD